MPEIYSDDRRYLLAVQGDGNVVVYDLQLGVPVWDRWSYEAGGQGPIETHPQPEPHPNPVERKPDPQPTGSLGPQRLIRITDESYPEAVNRGYSYWANTWIDGHGRAYLFCGHVDGVVRFYMIDLATDNGRPVFVNEIGRGTAEGWYWAALPWIYRCDGPRLVRHDPFTGTLTTIFSIEDRFPGCRLHQAHSSDDGQAHSATVQRITSEGAYPKLGTIVWRRGSVHWFASPGALDESQIDKSGDFVVIKEGEDNWIMDLARGNERVIPDADGALGHSDNGDGFMVGEDNISGACVRLDLRTFDRRALFSTWGMGHVSVRGDRVLVSNSTTKALDLIDLRDGAIRTVLPDLPGWNPNDYDTQVRAALSPCGRVASFISNREGRFDLYLLVL